MMRAIILWAKINWITSFYLNGKLQGNIAKGVCVNSYTQNIHPRNTKSNLWGKLLYYEKEIKWITVFYFNGKIKGNIAKGVCINSYRFLTNEPCLFAKTANGVCSTAVAHICAKAISDASTNQVLKFLLYLSNWSLQKTLLPLRRFQAPYFPRGFCEVEIALEFGVEWLRGEGWFWLR